METNRWFSSLFWKAGWLNTTLWFHQGGDGVGGLSRLIRSCHESSDDRIASSSPTFSLCHRELWGPSHTGSVSFHCFLLYFESLPPRFSAIYFLFIFDIFGFFPVWWAPPVCGHHSPVLDCCVSMCACVCVSVCGFYLSLTATFVNFKIVFVSCIFNLSPAISTFQQQASVNEWIYYWPLGLWILLLNRNQQDTFKQETIPRVFFKRQV